MKNDKLTLRMKITLIFILSSTLMCVILILFVFQSSNKLMEAFPPTAAIPSMEAGENSKDLSVFSAPQTIPATAIQEANRVFRLEILYMMIGVIFLGATMIFFLTSRALKPLETLTDKVSNQKIDDLSQEILLPHSNDEVYQLTKAFNQRNRQIFDAYSIQKNFSANAAHELCTPLAVIQTKLDVFLLNQNRSLDEYKILIGFFEENIQKLSEIVGNLLKLANSDNVDLSQKIFLNDLIEETIFEFEDTLKKQNITAKILGENITVHGNDTLLKQAIYNLFNNAIKYNYEGGNILISVIEKEETIEISISDTGIGIPDQCKQNLFEPFYRVDKSHSTDSGGSGLGLALVKKIIELHRGEIKVIDNIPQGSTFIVILNK